MKINGSTWGIFLMLLPMLCVALWGQPIIAMGMIMLLFFAMAMMIGAGNEPYDSPRSHEKKPPQGIGKAHWEDQAQRGKAVREAYDRYQKSKDEQS